LPVVVRNRRQAMVVTAKPPHRYALTLVWEGNRGPGTSDYATYGREYRVRIAGKPDLVGSADPLFRGDSALHNPEDLLVAALSACHMLSYLALCARSRISVLTYTDAAEGTLAFRPDGGGSFQEVVLRPRVTVAPGADLARATALHEKASEQCFIAASCNFPVRHQPVVELGSAP
jgi:organic hydroperoxide reductase OsmC/OhrA